MIACLVSESNALAILLNGETGAQREIATGRLDVQKESPMNREYIGDNCGVIQALAYERHLGLTCLSQWAFAVLLTPP